MTAALDVVEALELSHQERCQQITRQVGRALVHPGVLVDLTAKEARAVGSLLPDDLGALGVLVVIDKQRATLPAGDVLRVVPALGPERPEGPEVLTLVVGAQ